MANAVLLAVVMFAHIQWSGLAIPWLFLATPLGFVPLLFQDSVALSPAAVERQWTIYCITCGVNSFLWGWLLDFGCRLRNRATEQPR